MIPDPYLFRGDRPAALEAAGTRDPEERGLFVPPDPRMECEQSPHSMPEGVNVYPDPVPWIQLQRDPLDGAVLKGLLKDPRAGALLLFEGVARNHHEGQKVLSLAYEAYESMALEELAKIREEALRVFDLHQCLIHHRLGPVNIGEAAVVVALASVHRQEGFAALAWIMDQLKTRVPIWKREHYQEGGEAWVEGEHRV